MSAYSNIVTADGIALGEALLSKTLYRVEKEGLVLVDKERKGAEHTGAEGWWVTVWNGTMLVQGNRMDELFVRKSAALDRVTSLREAWFKAAKTEADTVYKQEQQAAEKVQKAKQTATA